MSDPKPNKIDFLNLIEVNPMSIIAPWWDSYFKNCRWPPNLDINPPKYAVLCDEDKSI